MPDFISQVDAENPQEGFKTALTELFDGMLALGLTDTQKEQIARMRASTQIVLQDF